MNNSIIRRVMDGVEFFTVNETGEPGMSKSGLAILCGVKPNTISTLVSNLIKGRAPKRLKPWIGKPLHLVTSSGEKYTKQGGTVDILRAEFCAAVIKHYALEGYETAEYSLDTFMVGGISTWIHGITGWQAKPQPITIEQWLDIAIIKIPKRWHRHFKMDWFAEACRLNGWQVYEHGTGPAAMSKFINATVYDVLPKGTRDRIDAVNPIDPVTGKRRKKNHQHFNNEVDETVLKVHIRTVFDLMASSASLYQFWDLMRNRFGSGLQLPIPGVMELPGS